jgi:hypothetical protein
MTMWRHRWFVGGAAAMLLASCADRPGPVLSIAPGTEVKREVAPDGYEAPSYASESSVPPEYLWAEVRSHRERVSWEGNQALGYGSMEYFGNRGRIELILQVLHSYSTVGSTRTERERADILPAIRVMGIPLPYTVPESCGQTANMVALYSARTILFVDTKITEVGPDIADGHTSGNQPECPPPGSEGCGSTGPGEDPDYPTSISPAPGASASPDGYLYDPYDPGYGSDTPSGCPGGSTDGGSEPTFAAMCGSWGGKLYYDYGCIEQYNAARGQWEEIWCGTYATCET